MPLAPLPATPDTIAAAAAHLRGGALVAFPTETVYGLGADACNGKAVAEIYASKGRPSFNPLIIHVAHAARARDFVVMTPLAERLAAAFWPGGLTMVLDRQPDSALSDLVSAGLPTIALRVPSHPVARDLLEAAGCPVAAPSANRSGHVSPTSAAHVAADLDPAAAAPALRMILDGGSCPLGIESTIIDARGATPQLLRQGAITVEALAAASGVAVAISSPISDDATPRTSPGQLASHYAPSKRLFIDVENPAAGQAVLAFGQPPVGHLGPTINLSPSGDLVEAAANLFAALRALDGSTAGSIAAMPVPDTGLGRAINDRLRRAAANA